MAAALFLAALQMPLVGRTGASRVLLTPARDLGGKPSLALVARAGASTAARARAPLMKSRVVFSDRPVQLDDDAEEPGRFQGGYVFCFAVTAAAWGAYTCGAYSTLAMPACSRVLGALSFMAPMGVAWGSFDALSNAARIGSGRLRLPNYRRMNLGLVSSTVWASVCVGTTPSVAPLLRLSCIVGLLFSASFCARVWWLSLSSRSLARLGDVTNGVLGSLWLLPPRSEECHPDVVGAFPDGCASLDDPESWPFFHANEYAFLCAAFAGMAFLASLAPLPLCGLPLAVAGVPPTLAPCRASAPWLWLAAVNLFVLKDGAERGRLWMKRFWRLRRGVAIMAVARLTAGVAGAALAPLLSLPAGAWPLAPLGISLALFALSGKAVQRTQNQGGQLFRGSLFSRRRPPAWPED
jgi:hypothetical protein